MARGRRFLGQLVLVLAMMAAGFVGAKLGLLGTREVGASHNFNDVPPDAFYHDFVQFLVENGITAGCGPGLFCGEQAVTRGQTAVFLKKLSDLVDQRVAAAVATNTGAFITAPGVVDVGGVTNCFGPDQWQYLSPNVNEIVQYARDSAGYVHLRGLAQRCGSAGAMFTLPAGFRPGKLQHVPAAASTGIVEVNVDSAGAVTSPIPANQWQALDGISFRCAPAGSDGCP